MGRCIVIGDVHGCARELRELLGACEHQPGDDVVLVGDLLSKGPDGHGVLSVMREVDARAVMGNHDAHMLRWKRARDAGEALPPLGGSTAALAETLGEADWALLAALPPFLRLPEHHALVVHAGLLPGIPVEEQDPELLYSIRTIRPDGRGSSRPDDGVLWGSLWPGPELVLFGHHASEGLQRHPHAIGLDTGCVYGGELSACILPGQEIRSVPAHETYEPPTVRVPVPGADELSPGHVLAVPLPRSPGGIPREALVLRDHGGELRAYLNRCQHLPIPIDGGSRRYLCDDGQHLLCGTHGARYRLEDGFCVAGPCSGTSLQPLTLQRRGDQVLLRVEVARGTKG